VTDSSRLSAFLRDAATDAERATADLLADYARNGGPFVEDIPGTTTSNYTFVWRGSEGPVALNCQLFPEGRRDLERVAGTDIWYLATPGPRHVTTTYQFVVNDPIASMSPEQMAELMSEPDLPALVAKAAAHGFADPYNPRRLLPQSFVDSDLTLTEANWESQLIAPGARTDDVFTTPGPRGESRTFRFSSTVFDNEREITVHTPPGYDSAVAHPVLVQLDGEYWIRICELPRALDHLTSTGAIRPVITVFVHNPTNMSRMTEMACNPDLATFIADELLPHVRAELNCSSDPGDVVVSGWSYGGLAAAYVAFQRPDAVGNVLSTSGSYWWGLADPESPFPFGRDDEPEWLTREIAAAPTKPIRWWLDVGSLEGGPLPQAPGSDQVQANRHLRTVLQAKGYEVAGYLEVPGAHDSASMRLATVEGLRALLGPTHPRDP
jgi:enterochelin esterase family protein